MLQSRSNQSLASYEWKGSISAFLLAERERDYVE